MKMPADAEPWCFRWKVACSTKPPFPEPVVRYLSGTVEEESGFVLQSPASLHFIHAEVPQQVPYRVLYYAGSYSPRAHAEYYNGIAQELPVGEGCSHQWVYEKATTDSSALFVDVRIVFDDEQAFVSSFKEQVWTIKQTLSAPTASAPFIAWQGETEGYLITVSCTPAECGSLGNLLDGTATPNCRVAFRYSADGAIATCEAPCDVNIQDLDELAAWGSHPQYVPTLLDVQARCQHDTAGWIPSDFAVFLSPLLTKPALNPMPTPSPAYATQTGLPMTPAPLTPSPPAQLNLSNWRICCPSVPQLEPCHQCPLASTEQETLLVLRGANMDLVNQIKIGERECPLSSQDNNRISCRIPAGLGTEDLKVTWRDGPVQTNEVMRDIVKYPAPNLDFMISGLLPTSGGNFVTVIGSNLGGGVFGGLLSDSASPWSVQFGSSGYRAAAAIGNTRASGVKWQSDSSLTLITPPGVGVDHKLLLTIHGAASRLPLAYSLSYDAPVLTEMKPSIGPGEGGILVTFLGESFGRNSHGGSKTLIFSSECSRTTWQSDSTMICVSPRGEPGIDVPVSVAVGGQRGVMQGGYQYTKASDTVVLLMSASPEELAEPSEERLSFCALTTSRLECFIKWLKVTLGLQEESQVYIQAVEPFRPSSDSSENNVRKTRHQQAGGAQLQLDPGIKRQRLAARAISSDLTPNRRRGLAGSDRTPSTRRRRIQSRLLLRFLESPKDPSRVVDTMLQDLEFLSTSKGAFAGSGLAVEVVQIHPDGPLISVLGPSDSSNSTVVSDENSDKSEASLSLWGALVGTIALFGAAAFFLWWRRRVSNREQLADSISIEISSTPRGISNGGLDASHTVSSMPDGSAPAPPDRNAATRSRFSLHAESVFGQTLSPRSDKTRQRGSRGRCVQCENSGFAVCVHKSMGFIDDAAGPGDLAEAESSDSDDSDNLCVVCLDGTREAIVVHADAAKSSHRVLCLACAYRILEQGGSCPMCRKTIFAVFKAK